MADRDAQPPIIARRQSIADVIRERPILFLTAALVGAAIAGTITFFALTLSGDEEAPIRVRNGSIDLYLLSKVQHFVTISGTSGNYKVSRGELFKEEYEVIVATGPGGTCSPRQTGAGRNVVVTYHDDDNNQDFDVRLEATGKHTTIKPGPGVSLQLDAQGGLTFGTKDKGHISRVQVGSGTNGMQCSFTSRESLQDLLLLNVPR